MVPGYFLVITIFWNIFGSEYDIDQMWETKMNFGLFESFLIEIRGVIVKKFIKFIFDRK